MERDYTRLLKSNWFANDIQAYYGISSTYADRIKTYVENEYGCVETDIGKERRAVRADDVIKSMGGKSRLEEAQIFVYAMTQPPVLKDIYKLVGSEND